MDANPADTTPPLRYDGPQVLADHIEQCTDVDAVLVMHTGSGDDVVATLLAQGWRLDEQVDYVAGKRIRTLVAPDVP